MQKACSAPFEYGMNYVIECDERCSMLIAYCSLHMTKCFIVNTNDMKLVERNAL